MLLPGNSGEQFFYTPTAVLASAVTSKFTRFIHPGFLIKKGAFFVIKLSRTCCKFAARKCSIQINRTRVRRH